MTKQITFSFASEERMPVSINVTLGRIDTLIRALEALPEPQHSDKTALSELKDVRKETAQQVLSILGSNND
jgi:hypothetical protein